MAPIQPTQTVPHKTNPSIVNNFFCLKFYFFKYTNTDKRCVFQQLLKTFPTFFKTGSATLYSIICKFCRVCRSVPVTPVMSSRLSRPLLWTLYLRNPHRKHSGLVTSPDRADDTVRPKMRSQKSCTRAAVFIVVG